MLRHSQKHDLNHVPPGLPTGLKLQQPTQYILCTEMIGYEYVASFLSVHFQKKKKQKIESFTPGTKTCIRSTLDIVSLTA